MKKILVSGFSFRGLFERIAVDHFRQAARLRAGACRGGEEPTARMSFRMATSAARLAWRGARVL